MKSILIGVCIIFHGIIALGQGSSTTRNSELEQLINVPALIPEQDPPTDGSTSGPVLQFDKCIMVTVENPASEQIHFNLYINTRNGDIAIIHGKSGVTEDGSFKTDDLKFQLTYYNPHGRFYNFFTRKKNGNIVRYMSSLNTEIVAMTPDLPFQSSTVFRTGDGINPLPQNFDANSYKAAGNQSPTYILCGGKPGTKPNKLWIKRFIGYSGIGYVKTNEGIFMQVKVKSSQGTFTANKWKNGNYKIVLSDFKHLEGEMYNHFTEKNEQQTAKLEAKSFSGNCADIERNINNLKIEQKRKEKKNIADMTKGNPIQDASVTRSWKKAYGDPLEQLRIAEMEVELRLCKLENIRIKTPSDEKRRVCLEAEKNRIQQAAGEIKALQERYSGPNDPPLMTTVEYREINKRMRTKSPACN